MGKEVERQAWSNKVEFFLSCVGYAVGLGNVWRFPYKCYRNGGGAFLIPYILMLVLVGLPCFFLELAFGQFASLGPFTIWRASPLFKGVGFASIALSVLVSIYYNVIIAYSLFYMLVTFVSFDGDVPWATCNNPWNTQFCITESIRITDDMNETQKLNITLGRMNTTCVDNILDMGGMNFTDLSYNFTQTNLSTCSYVGRYKLPSDEYFSRYVLRLHEATDFGDVGGISLKLALTLLLAWIFVFFALKNGVKSSGKIIYFTALFPYVVLVILLIRGLTLEGYMEGIKFYVIPKWEKLATPQVWVDAASQIFYSLGPAFGSLLTMASYNQFKNNCYRDAILVAVINCATSVFAGFVIFAVLGFMAHVTNQEVGDVATGGPGLVFIAYPEGIARMPYPPIWAFLFFFMLLSLGMSSQFAMVEAIISALADEFPSTLRRNKAKLCAAVCLVLFLCGLPLVTNGGIWVLTLMDDYSGSYSLLFVCMIELIAIAWVYGHNRFLEDLYMMLGFKVNYYWVAMWKFVAPVIIVLILIASGIQFSPSGYGDFVFPTWVQGVGWGLVSIPIVLLLGTMLIQLIRYGGFRNASRPQKDWGPALPENRTGRYADYLEVVYESKKEDIQKNGVIEMDKNEPNIVEQMKKRRESAQYNKGYEMDEKPVAEQNGHTVQSEDDKL
ncbi:sodium-dependent proline transporter-like [Mytilus edulis]|uniref:sodium-dependent proline transporter-like n=1 Tax=Mytilus edulis TaxID=6550 RepID=UPI0039EEDD61